MTDNKLNIILLHRHWLAADTVRESLKKTAKNLHPLSAQNILDITNDFDAIGRHYSFFLKLSVWYALIYVVLEGYQELGLHCKNIDKLLADKKMVSSLRRFRNATFHYQQEIFSDKLSAFLENTDSEIWIRNINRELKHYFETELSILEEMSILKKNQANHAQKDNSLSYFWRKIIKFLRHNLSIF